MEKVSLQIDCLSGKITILTQGHLLEHLMSNRITVVLKGGLLKALVINEGHILSIYTF